MQGCSVFLKALCANGAVINTAIVLATAEGIMRHYDSNLLVKKWWFHSRYQILGQLNDEFHKKAW